MQLARGEWVAFLDADDVWEPTKLERQIERLSKNIEDVACVHTGYHLFGARTHSPRVPEWANRERFTSEEMILRPLVHVSTALVRRAGPVRFPEWTDAAEDMIYFADLASTGRFLYVGEHLLGYRIHDRQQHVSSDHIIRHTNSRLRWVETHRADLGEAESERLRLEIQYRPIKKMRAFKRQRQWPEYWKLREYVTRLAWPSAERPASLDERIYPRSLYQVKDLLRRNRQRRGA
jgi:glycosyltransferase involved in cell wall biosynthesis